MATLKDISRLVGLSVTQVSRALNGHSDVNLETRRRVEEAAKSLNYHPNISARKLVSGRSGMVALVATQHPGLTRDTTFVETVTGLSEQFSSRNMQFILHIASSDETVEETYGRLIDSGSLDGFVLMEPQPEDTRIRYLQARQVPFVVHGNTGEGADYPYYEIDNFDVGYSLAKHLIGQGHEAIALLNGRAELNYARQRQRGLETALEEAGLSFEPSLVRSGRMTESFGMVSVIQMFSEDHLHPTAAICSNILIARGAYRAADALGLVIPRDFSVVAHDDGLPQHQTAGFLPALTVTMSPLSDSWGPLADNLIGRIEDKPLKDLQKISLCDFLKRHSVAAPGTA